MLIKYVVLPLLLTCVYLGYFGGYYRRIFIYLLFLAFL